MGYVPAPNVYRMTDEEFEAWWRHEQKSMAIKWSILAIGAVLFLGLTIVVVAASLLIGS